MSDHTIMIIWVMKFLLRLKDSFIAWSLPVSKTSSVAGKLHNPILWSSWNLVWPHWVCTSCSSAWKSLSQAYLTGDLSLNLSSLYKLCSINEEIGVASTTVKTFHPMVYLLCFIFSCLKLSSLFFISIYEFVSPLLGFKGFPGVLLVNSSANAEDARHVG